ncbi:MAG: DMT family transporter [Candidatus Paceibacterota bacterium]
MIWALLAFCGAFFQALGSAVFKRALRIHDRKYIVGFISYAVAGIIFFAFHYASSGSFWMRGLSEKFWIIIVLFGALNGLGAWFLYRALEFAELNYVMPFMTFTALSLIVPPIFLLGEIPSLGSVFGMALIVCGAALMNYSMRELTSDEIQRRAMNRKGLNYFLVTALCFTILPTFAKVAIQESSVWFASFLTETSTAVVFLVILLFKNEWRDFREFFVRKNRTFLMLVLLSGLIYVGENGTINTALHMAPVAQVFAIKRTMPLFAFLIGLFTSASRATSRKK